MLRTQQASNQGSLQGSVLVIHARSRNGPRRRVCRVVAPRREGIDRPQNRSDDKAEQPDKAVGAEDEK